MGVRFYYMGEHVVTASFTPDAAQEGPPFHAHGGVLATVLDEAMGMSAWSAKNMCVAVNLNFSYKSPVPLGTTMHINSRVDRVEGRKVFTIGTITLPDADGEYTVIAVEGQGVFVEAPQFFKPESDGFQFYNQTPP